MSLLQPLSEQLHAAHAPGSPASAKAAAAAAVRAALAAAVSAQAHANLDAASRTLAASADLSHDPLAAGALSGASAFLASVAQRIRAGSDPASALATTPAPDAPGPGVSDALTHLLASLSLRFGGPHTATAEAGLPLVERLAELSAAADQQALAWGAHVALPFASGVAFAGASDAHAEARRAELALGYAAHLQARGA